MLHFFILASSISIAFCITVPDLPALEDKWWGEGRPVEENQHVIGNMKIDVSQEILEDLCYRLNRTKPFQPSLQGVNQRYGIHNTVLNRVLDFWKTEYNWQKRQDYLNQYPHHYVYIRGLKIHYLHVKPKITGAKIRILPLIMVHGWPGSIREFYDVIPLLTEQRSDKNFVFELIIPSLPGFGFSDYSIKPGLSAAYMGQIFKDLMTILGFEKFYVQGGDWGSSIVLQMAVFYPENVIGVHSNMCFVNTALSNFRFFLGKYFPSWVYDDKEAKLCNSTANSVKFLIEETGYFHLQATKPDTVGVALRDSPMGLAAYILEKFITLTDADYRDLEDGGLTKKFSMNQLLDNIMIYWVTGSMTSAMRIYAEAFTNFELEFESHNKIPIQIPSGCARFPKEILLTPRSILIEKHKNLVHLTEYQRGGHFAAFEEPRLFSSDLFLFVQTVEELRKNTG